VIIIAALVTIHRVARSVSYGTRPSDLELGADNCTYQSPIRVNHDDRRFGPGIYELALCHGVLGVTGRHGVALPTSTVARVFYPQWWFHPSDVTVSTGESKALFRGAHLPSILLQYRREGERHTLEIVPSELAVLVERLAEAGFSS